MITMLILIIIAPNNANRNYNNLQKRQTSEGMQDKHLVFPRKLVSRWKDNSITPVSMYVATRKRTRRGALVR